MKYILLLGLLMLGACATHQDTSGDGHHAFRQAFDREPKGSR